MSIVEKCRGVMFLFESDTSQRQIILALCSAAIKVYFRHNGVVCVKQLEREVWAKQLNTLVKRDDFRLIARFLCGVRKGQEEVASE